MSQAAAFQPESPVTRLERLGQSVWLDSIDRGLIESGRLRRLIEEDGLRGMTSNPAIFEKAIAHGSDYDSAIRRASSRAAISRTDGAL